MLKFNPFYKKNGGFLLLIVEFMGVIFLCYRIIYTTEFNLNKHSSSGLITNVKKVHQYNPYLVQVRYYNDLINRTDTIYVEYDGFAGNKLYNGESLEIYYGGFFPRDAYVKDYSYPSWKHLFPMILGLIVLSVAIYFSIWSITKGRVSN